MGGGRVFIPRTKGLSYGALDLYLTPLRPDRPAITAEQDRSRPQIQATPASPNPPMLTHVLALLLISLRYNVRRFIQAQHFPPSSKKTFPPKKTYTELYDIRQAPFKQNCLLCPPKTMCDMSLYVDTAMSERHLSTLTLILPAVKPRQNQIIGFIRPTPPRSSLIMRLFSCPATHSASLNSRVRSMVLFLFFGLAPSDKTYSKSSPV